MLIRKSPGEEWREPVVQAYEDEAELQELLRKSPSLLPGVPSEAIVAAELEIPGVGAADLVALTPEGEITIVECKLRGNPEIRRWVIGQLFAYAAGLWRITYEDISSLFAKRLGGPLVEAVRNKAAGGDWDEEAFRQEVVARLTSGRLRLIVAVDEITDELKRTISWLNDHTVPEVQVLAFEVGRVKDGDIEILVPTVYGEETTIRKENQTRYWTADAFNDYIATNYEPSVPEAIQDLFNLANSKGAALSFGKTIGPAVTFNFDRLDGQRMLSLGLYEWPRGTLRLAFQFEYMIGKAGPEHLERLVKRLRQVASLVPILTGLEQAEFRRRPAIVVNEIATHPALWNEIKQAVEDAVSTESGTRTEVDMEVSPSSGT